ncbi:MAG: histidine--tRNA ligase [Mycoplasmatota bacterium]
MIQKPKGTYDVTGDYGRKTLYLQKLLESLMEKYNYDYIRTPLFESSALFKRGVGETTDIVSKETYDFIDRGNRDMTLRPEGTAGVVRSFIENKMYADPNVPVKNWYFGTMYRYERPQSGRYREFVQFGVEVFGSNDPLTDAEVISIPVTFFKLIGLKGIKVKVNTLGDIESRNNYKKALLDYFLPHLDTLCEDCKKRYEKNPLRILDCKIDSKKEIFKNIPKMSDYLTKESKEHFDLVLSYLKSLDIEYIVDDSLVRGLDYYTNTVFEVEADIEGFGAQNVLCGGGRYNKLVEMLDGPSTPGVGFSLGLERILMALDFEKINIIEEKSIDAYIIPCSALEKEYAFALLNNLRLNGFNCDMDYNNRSVKSNFKQSDRLNSKFIIIIGEEEVKSNIVTIKNNETKEEQKIKIENLIEYLDSVIEVY